jgi:hypothetical protein
MWFDSHAAHESASAAKKPGLHMHFPPTRVLLGPHANTHGIGVQAMLLKKWSMGHCVTENAVTIESTATCRTLLENAIALAYDSEPLILLMRSICIHWFSLVMTINRVLSMQNIRAALW